MRSFHSNSYIFTRAARTRILSIYSIYIIYIITDISRLCSTGKKNIYDIYRTMSAMYVLWFENKLVTLCAFASNFPNNSIYNLFINNRIIF